jgi:hypothetical protein
MRDIELVEAGGVGISTAVEKMDVIKKRDAQNALTSENAANWNVSGTRL